MTRIFTVLAITVAFLSPAQASNPGEPLDCSDWVFVEPGVSCSVVISSPCKEDDGRLRPWCDGLNRAVVLNDGRPVRPKNNVHEQPICGLPHAWSRFELLALNGTSEQVLAYVDERCGQPGTRDIIDIPAESLVFVEESGDLFVLIRQYCFNPFGSGNCAYQSNPEEGRTLLKFSGFTTTFEILQTYTPPSGPLSFRVPYMPEGFQHADWFDTYYGSLATVGNWSQLQPLQCGYPASSPSVGDYLTVADPLPTPSPGQGYYYVTAVNFMGERRYGRQSTSGTLAGRDPAVLPTCK